MNMDSEQAANFAGSHQHKGPPEAELEALWEIAAAGLETGVIRSIEQILASAERLFSFEIAAVSALDWEGRASVVAKSGAESQTVVLAGYSPWDLRERDFDILVVPSVVDDRRLHEQARREFGRVGIVSAVFAALRNADELVGVLSFGSAHRRDLDDRERRIAQIIAWHTCLALKSVQNTQRLSDAAEIVNTSTDGMFSKTVDGEILSWNPAAERVYGYKAQEVIGQHVSMLVPPDKQLELAHLLEQVKAGSRIVRHESTRRRKDGTLFPVVLDFSPIQNDAGEVVRIATISRDNTAFRSSAKELKERAATLEAFLEAMSQAFLAVDEQGVIQMVNRQTAVMFGCQRDELLGTTVEDLVPQAVRSAHKLQREGYFRDPKVRPMGVGMDLFGKRKDGSEFPVEISLSYVEQNGKPTALAFISDTSERKRLEQQFLESQKLESLAILAGGIAHDFNNLLTGITGSASLAFDDLKPTDPLRHLFENILEASGRAAELVKQLLAYAGKGQFVVHAVNISDRARSITALIKGAVPRTIDLTFDLQSNLPPITSDPSQIDQVIMNLVLNAAEAIGHEKPGKIRIRTFLVDEKDGPERRFPNGNIRHGKYVCLEITDTGHGIDDATKAKIFDPFFTTKFMGRGLGLAAVSGIVRSLKGSIEIDSTPGTGSTFRVYTPVESHHEQQDSAKILIVDDEPLVRNIAKMTLEKAGFQVIQAEHGDLAVEIYKQTWNDIALVVLDYTMPVMTGPETLKHLLSINPNAKVILSSGFAESEVRQRFEGARVVGFLQKPYTAAQMKSKIESALGHP